MKKKLISMFVLILIILSSFSVLALGNNNTSYLAVQKIEQEEAGLIGAMWWVYNYVFIK